MSGLDENCRRAWGHHFRALAADYERQALLSVSLARRARGKDRSRWVANARRLNRAAVRCAQNARDRGVRCGPESRMASEAAALSDAERGA